MHLPARLFNFLKNDFYVSCFWMLLLANKYSIKFVGENVIIQKCSCIKMRVQAFVFYMETTDRQIYASFPSRAILPHPPLSPRLPFGISNKIHTYHRSSYKIKREREKGAPKKMNLMKALIIRLIINHPSAKMFVCLRKSSQEMHLNLRLEKQPLYRIKFLSLFFHNMHKTGI